jgi:hypothetical protein
MSASFKSDRNNEPGAGQRFRQLGVDSAIRTGGRLVYRPAYFVREHVTDIGLS